MCQSCLNIKIEASKSKLFECLWRNLFAIISTWSFSKVDLARAYKYWAHAQTTKATDIAQSFTNHRWWESSSLTNVSSDGTRNVCVFVRTFLTTLLFLICVIIYLIDGQLFFHTKNLIKVSLNTYCMTNYILNAQHSVCQNAGFLAAVRFSI